MKNSIKIFLILVIGLIMAVSFAACGGSDSSDDETTPTPKYTVGGTVSGLSGTGLVLQCNGADNKTVTSNGSFTFATAMDDGSPYAVTVKTHPSSLDQTCTTNTGSGTISGANITGVTVTCATNVPPSPANVQATPGEGKITASWDAVAGATSYNVYWSKTQGDGTNGTAVNVAGTSHDHEKLVYLQDYYYVVSALDSNGESLPSSEATGTPSRLLIASITFTDNNLGTCVDTYAKTNADEITSLNCASKGISDIDGIGWLTSLTSLQLHQNNISDISDLEGLTSLTSLRLNGNNIISDISVVSGFSGLTYLDFHNNSISDISAVSGLTNLTYLDLSGNISISDISAVSNLANLVYLKLSVNNISDISAVSGLTNLTWLALSDNNISGISDLAGLTGLTHLFLAQNSINNISTLAGLTSLTWLELYYNSGLSDISALSGLASLTILNLHSNSVSDVSDLAGLTSLTNLYLNNNSITAGVATLTGLESATVIDFTGNTGITCANPDVATLIAALPGVVTYDENVHSNGLGQTFSDCVSTGTINETQAYWACIAFTGDVSKCDDFIDACGSAPDTSSIMCGDIDAAQDCGCWAYTGPVAGLVYNAPASNICECPFAGDPTWD